MQYLFDTACVYHWETKTAVCYSYSFDKLRRCDIGKPRGHLP